MSDALLTEISSKLGKILAALEKGGAPAVAPKTTTPAPTGGAAPDAAAKAAAAAAAKKAADDKKKLEAAAAAKAAAGTKPAVGPVAGTKAPGGKHTVDQVRAIIRKVAAEVDKQSAKDILKDDGGGADNVITLKPEFYDAVFEACEVLLGGEGSSAGPVAEEDDLM